MDYPVTKTIVEHLLAGFWLTVERHDKLEAKVSAALARLPLEQRQSLSTNAIFANAAMLVATSPELRTMTANPAFKVEPVISQLRRAEAAYIEAHDAYLASRDKSRYLEEMRWAHGRLRIARQFYNSVMASLPPKKRGATVTHPVNGSRIAIKDLKLSAFSEEEQRALRLAITDREAAIERVDQIIAAGRASTNDLRIMHAYLIDPAAGEQIERWLVDQSATSYSAQETDRPTTDVAGAAANTESASASIPQPVVVAAKPAEPSADAPADAAIAHAISVIDGWLNKMPVMLDQFVKVDALWRFNGEIKARVYATAYNFAVSDPRFQRMIDARKSHRVGPADVPERLP